MNILYFLENFPKVSETFILNEIYELEQRGHNIAVFALNNPDEDIMHEEFGDLEAEVYYADYPSYSDFNKILWHKLADLSFLKTLKLNKGVKNRLTQAYMSREIVNFCNEVEFDPNLIQTHFSNSSKLHPYSASKILDIPFSIEVHAYDIFRKDNIEFSRKFLKKPDNIITVSKYNRNYLKKEFGLEKSIDIIPVSVRPEKFESQGFEEKNKIVSVGRLVEKKGFKYGIKAFAKLKEKYPKLEYNLIGEGELETELKQLSEELGVRQDINFPGYISDKELKKEMEEAKVFLLPCVKAENGDLDAMPMVLKEAMALKTPCVSTTVSAIPELIEDGKDGFLVDSRNADTLSENAKQLIQSGKKREKMGKKARQKIVRDYDISTNIKNIEESFEKAVE